ncbi:MAG: phage protease [Syntrophales bacterium]|jgi:phage I-like protein|nr:phage protease [Syntrophales bacterium]MCK9390270.1 phage protease [Syntrophales bacterium]
MGNTLVLICKEVAGVPAEIQVIPFGNINTPKGPFTLDDESAQGVVAAFEAQKNDMVIDYEHQTLMGVQAPAAGWIKKLINKGTDGVWAVVEWTERAKEYLANKEYRYVSPVFLKRKSDHRVVRLINVALTNEPNIDGMVPLINKSSEYQFETINQRKEEDTMKELLKLLGLAETATEQDAIMAVNKLKEPVQIVANKGVLTALGLSEAATEAEITGTIMAMKQSHGQVGTLAQEVAQLKEQMGANAATELVALAMKEGKITPAQKEWAGEYAKRDIEGFKVFVAKAPVVVVMGKVVGNEKPAEGALDETQAMINKQCGVDAETYKKYGPKEQQ